MTDEKREAVVVCLECGANAKECLYPPVGWHFLGAYTAADWEFHDFCSLACLKKWLEIAP